LPLLTFIKEFYDDDDDGGGIVPKWMKIGSCGLHCEVAKTLKHSSFLTPTKVGDNVPFHLIFALKVTHALWRAPTSTNTCL